MTLQTYVTYVLPGMVVATAVVGALLSTALRKHRQARRRRREGGSNGC